MSTRSNQFFRLIVWLECFLKCWNQCFSVLKYFSEVECFFADEMHFIAKSYVWIIFFSRILQHLKSPIKSICVFMKIRLASSILTLNLINFEKVKNIVCLRLLGVLINHAADSLRFLRIFSDFFKSQFLPCITESLEIKLIKIYESKHSRMDQVKFGEDSL